MKSPERAASNTFSPICEAPPVGVGAGDVGTSSAEEELDDTGGCSVVVGAADVGSGMMLVSSLVGSSELVGSGVTVDSSGSSELVGSGGLDGSSDCSGCAVAEGRVGGMIVRVTVAPHSSRDISSGQQPPSVQ
jgi:hypothetical protein